MNNKAESILLMIFEVLIVAFVIYLTISIAHAYGSSLLTVKANTAEDMVMMVHTLIGVPGDAVVKYPQNVSELTVVLQQGKVSVFEPQEQEAAWITRPIFLPQWYTSEGIVSNQSTVCLKKENKRIILQGCN